MLGAPVRKPLQEAHYRDWAMPPPGEPFHEALALRGAWAQSRLAIEEQSGEAVNGWLLKLSQDRTSRPQIHG